LDKLLLFDFDGVVIDSLEVYEGTVRDCLMKIGQPLVKTREDFLALFEENFYEALVKKGVNLDLFMEASVDILARIDYSKIKPFPAVLPVLCQLRERHRMVVISSSDAREIAQITERFQINGVFEEVLGSDRGFSKKEKIHYCLDKYGVKKENTYYICDTTGDIKEAKEVGIKTVAVSWGWHEKGKLLAAGPDYLIERPEELLCL